MSPPAGVPMTTVHVPLSEAAWQRLRQRAAERGVAPEELARTVLEQEAAPPAPDPSAEQLIAELRAWIASHPKRDIKVDDSRESIYEGCGESGTW